MKCSAVTDKLMSDVIRLVAGGGYVPEIKAWLTKHHPQVDHEEVFAKVSEHFNQVASGSEDELVGFCIEATKTLYRKMLSDDDSPGALKAVQHLSKLGEKMNSKIETKKYSNNRERQKKLTVLKRVENAS